MYTILHTQPDCIKEISFDDSITKELIKGISNKMDDYFIEGLRRKGFEFENKAEIYSFIKERCRCEDSLHLEERVYFVDNTPFFLHKYETEIDIKTITEDRKITMSANNGYFACL